MSPNLSWTLSPPAILVVAVIGGAYLARWRRVRRGTGRRGQTDAPVWRLCCFYGSLLSLLIALVSPIDALGDQLLVMHMVQHILLLDIAPILCILGFNKVLLRPVTRQLHSLERKAGPFSQPAFAVSAASALRSRRPR